MGEEKSLPVRHYQRSARVEDIRCRQFEEASMFVPVAHSLKHISCLLQASKNS